ncbi:MAG: pyruvate formate-lyase-activating protein [Bacilli bacterium]
MKGSINSFESLGSVDGPGTRFVIFFQGCPLQCLYCHNPETQPFTTSNEYTIQEVVMKVRKLKHYYQDGGITISGGEPLLQIDFLLGLVKSLKKELGLHIALDTSGISFNQNDPRYSQLLDYIDLFMVDIKHIDDQKCLALTKVSNQQSLRMIEYLALKEKEVWIRYVLVPGYTDNEIDLINTGQYIMQFSNISNVEILPFHNMGASKYEQLNIDYQLSDVEDATTKDITRAYQIMFPHLN